MDDIKSPLEDVNNDQLQPNSETRVDYSFEFFDPLSCLIGFSHVSDLCKDLW